MKNVKDSVILLLSFLSIVFGIAQVEGFEDNILNFQAAFFIMMALATILGVLGPSQVKVSLFSYIIAWAIIYALVWWSYWRFLPNPRSVQELGVQFLLIEIAAGLSHSLGQSIAQVDFLLDGLSASTYPNRALSIEAAHDRIDIEITRSRRYNRPLSVLVFEISQVDEKDKNVEVIQKDLLKRFALAKVGQILGNYARQTDLILDDQPEHFIVVCPETDHQTITVLADRIRMAIREQMNTWVTWGTASFPNEALTFDDLLNTARERISRSGTPVEVLSPVLEENETHNKGI